MLHDKRQSLLAKEPLKAGVRDARLRYIAALMAEENMAETHILLEQANVRARAKQLLMGCEAQRVRLKGGDKA